MPLCLQHPTAPAWVQPRAPSAAVPCSKDVDGRITLGILCARGDDAGVRLCPAPGRCALGAARAERALPQAVAPSSLGDCPGCWPSAGPGRGGRTCQPGLSDPAISEGGGEDSPLWLSLSPGSRASAFSFARPSGKASRLWPSARRESGRAALVFKPLFSGWKGNDGRGQPFPRQSPHPFFLTPALPGLRSVSGPGFHSLAMTFPWLCSWAVAPLLLNLLSEVPHPLIAQKGVVVFLFVFIFLPHIMAYSILVLPPGDGTHVPWALEAQRLNFPWTDREVPCHPRKL